VNGDRARGAQQQLLGGREGPGADQERRAHQPAGDVTNASSSRRRYIVAPLEDGLSQAEMPLVIRDAVLERVIRCLVWMVSSIEGGRAMNSPVVLITGALTGIGRAAAFIFAQDGAQVVVAGRRDDQGQALVAELLELGADAMFVHADVRHEDEVRNLVDETVRRFGRLDIAVNNAATEGLRGLVTAMLRRSTATSWVCC